MEDLSRHLALLTRDDAAGIDDLERSSIPCGTAIYAVSSDARLIGNNGPALPDDPVKQTGFANVRSADNGNQGQRRVHEGLWQGFRMWDSGYWMSERRPERFPTSAIQHSPSHFGA